MLLLAGRIREIDRYFVTFICASLFPEVASMPLPTSRPDLDYGRRREFHAPTGSTADIVLALHAGTLRIIDLQALDGIISFPSPHAAVAILIP